MTKINFLNCRSIRNKFHKIRSDGSLLKADVLILSETWLEVGTGATEYQLPEYAQVLITMEEEEGLHPTLTTISDMK